MLTLVSRFVSVCETLPSTSYIKAVDYWFLLCLAVPFLEVLLQVYLDKIRTKTEGMVKGLNIQIKIIALLYIYRRKN